MGAGSGYDKSKPGSCRNALNGHLDRDCRNCSRVLFAEGEKMAVSVEMLADKSPLISEELEDQISGIFAQLKKQVTVTSIVDDSDKSLEMAVFLKHLTGLSDKLTLRFIDKGIESGTDEALDSHYLPATGFHTESGYARTVFHGVPGGHELTGFVQAILAAGGMVKPLDTPTLREISKIQERTVIQIAVSLGCHHCAQTVMNAQRIAEENESVTVHTIDANLYPSLVERYKIERVPIVLMDGRIVGQTEMTIPELCKMIIKR